MIGAYSVLALEGIISGTNRKAMSYTIYGRQHAAKLTCLMAVIVICRCMHLPYFLLLI